MTKPIAKKPESSGLISPIDLFAEPARLPGFVSEELSGQRRLSGVGPLSAKTFLISRLRNNDRLRQRVWLTADEAGAEAVAAQLRFWSNDQLHPLRLDDQALPRLLRRLLLAEPVWLVASVSAFERSVLPRPAFKDLTLHLQAGDALRPAELSQSLARIGYGFETTAHDPGTFARRGGIVDIFPIDADYPVRLEFDGRTLAGLHRLRGSKLGPLIRELTITPSQLTTTSGATLFSYLDGGQTLFVLSDPDQLGTVAPRWEAWSAVLAPYRSVIFETFSDETTQALDFHQAPFYHRDFEALGADLARYQREGWAVGLATERAKEVGQLFEHVRVAAPKVVRIDRPDALLTGFSAAEYKLLFLTDQEIFGRTERHIQATGKHKIDLAFMAELKPGDYVTHLDHGIARFLGMTKQQVDGHEREYFTLEYAGGDKLFVPVEAADKVSKYIGLANPKLHRLSGSNWYQLTRKIRDETLVLAQELLKLYAQRATTEAVAFSGTTDAERQLAASFPYQETDDQQQAINDVFQDLTKDTPMDRLVCGDVGFGKTEVAIRAAVRAAVRGTQVAVLSPTTILTQQHYDTFINRLQGLPLTIDLLSRFKSEKEQQQTLVRLATGDVDIVIGTHRLLSKDVIFKDLGLIIIDEEQRFGVKDKEQLKELRRQAHVLTLTATPIPRTLNLALSGIRDVSIIETPPEGRLPIETIIQPFADTTTASAIRKEISRGGQVYYVYNNVETIELALAKLKRLVPEASYAVAHGQMDEHKLSQVMADFDTGKVQVLVCSTIIENGLDLPNVNTLIVDNAGRFGLAQLYQLRGRIGRGSRQAYAYFLYQSTKLAGGPKKRLQALHEARDLGAGFQLALRDLEIRGTGNILGKEQHGQVAAIGLNLYTRLLAQAIEELKTGIKQEALRDIIIDLPLDIGIPKSIVPSEPKRLKFYQEMANLVGINDLREFKKKIFGEKDVPQPLHNLFDLLEIRLLAQKTHITSIAVTKTSVEGVSHQKLTIEFSNMITPKMIERLITKNQKWDFTTKLVKIDFAELGTKWLQQLKAYVRLFEREPEPVKAAETSETPAPQT
ncbi:MAG: transcription-repair coupling factor [Candidatus Kerfeldbacteria bacterium]|nr:transcription-repair coupling factor [Candidatus Kerfeldbacteria bacterium]